MTGAPRGARIIIGYTAQSIMNVLDVGLDPQGTISGPHYMNRNGRTDIETSTPGITLEYDDHALAEALASVDHHAGIIAQTIGLSIIQVVECDHCGRGNWHAKGRCHKHSCLIGGADQRPDGAVGGR